MDDQWIVWCGTNAEQDAIAAELGDECISIYGSLSPEEKVRREELWRTGKVRVLVTKPEIMGWGVNWQHCSRMVFVGLSDSFESYYQCVRRCWRFGQAREVVAHVVLTDPERVIWDNVQRKEREAEKMAAELVRHVARFEKAEIEEQREEDRYHAQGAMRLPDWI